MSKKASVLAAFTVAVLALVNKSEEEIQKEQVEDFRESCLIEANAQVELIKAENKRLDLDVKKHNRTLEVANKKLESVKYSLSENYETYFKKVSEVEHEILSISNTISNVNSQIKVNNTLLAKHEENIKLFS